MLEEELKTVFTGTKSLEAQAEKVGGGGGGEGPGGRHTSVFALFK